MEIHISPGDTTISVGQQFAAMVHLFGCHGTLPLTDTFTWHSQDTTVATVDSTSGIVTGVGHGHTLVFPNGKHYSIELPVSVTVR